MMVRDVVYPEAQPAFNLFIYLFDLGAEVAAQNVEEHSPEAQPAGSLGVFLDKGIDLFKV